MGLRKARFVWVILFATASPSDRSLRIGAVLVLLGEGLRVWANGYVGHRKVNATMRSQNDPKIGHLITAGPYSFFRNPLYIGTLLIGIGFCAAVRNPVLSALAVVLFLMVYRRKVRAEELVILQEWGEEFERYRAAIPRWFPSFRPYAHPFGEWSWQGVRASQEIWTILWLGVVFLGIYFREEWFGEHEFFVANEWIKQVFLFALMVGLVVWDALFEWARRRRSGPTMKTGCW
jgi:protein-S-isoprenylcysteine O-methyltransferase Ste14